MAAKIHPSSILDGPVELAQDVEIGPGCVITGPVTIGAGCRLLGHVYLKGPSTMGRGNVLYPFTTVGLEPQDRKYDPAQPGAGTVIGDDNILRGSVTIHRATGPHPTTLGSRNYLMVNSHVGHDATMGDDCALANGAALAGHVEVQNNVVMGGNAVVHQFCRLGRLSMQGGATGLVQDLPPFCTCYDTRTVGSLNLVGLRRAGYRRHIQALTEAFTIFFRGGHSNQVAMTTIAERLGDDPLCREFVAFIRGSKRGITGYQRGVAAYAREVTLSE